MIMIYFIIRNDYTAINGAVIGYYLSPHVIVAILSTFLTLLSI